MSERRPERASRGLCPPKRTSHDPTNSLWWLKRPKRRLSRGKSYSQRRTQKNANENILGENYEENRNESNDVWVATRSGGNRCCVSTEKVTSRGASRTI